MTGDLDDYELRARLRALDPAASLSPADPFRVARLLEDTMSNDPSTKTTETSETTETRETGTHGRSPLTWLVAAAAAVIIAAAGAFGTLHHDSGSDQPPAAAGDQTPTVTELTAPGGGVDARCMVPSAEVLGRASVAFDATVQKINDGVVTLVPTHFYAGAGTDVVTISAPSEQMQQLVGAVKFEDNGRYLVSATGGRVSVCGFSGPYSSDLAALYDAAFTG